MPETERTIQRVARFRGDYVRILGWKRIMVEEVLLILIALAGIVSGLMYWGFVGNVIASLSASLFFGIISYHWYYIVTHVAFFPTCVSVHGDRVPYDIAEEFIFRQLTEEPPFFCAKPSSEIWLKVAPDEETFVSALPILHPYEIVAELNRLLMEKKQEHEG